MSDIVLELCVWKQGRINLDILKNNFLSAIKHGGWDLAMEYQILTPSLFSPSAQEDQNSIECDKDLVMGMILYYLPNYLWFAYRQGQSVLNPLNNRVQAAKMRIPCQPQHLW